MAQQVGLNKSGELIKICSARECMYMSPIRVAFCHFVPIVKLDVYIYIDIIYITSKTSVNRPIKGPTLSGSLRVGLGS